MTPCDPSTPSSSFNGSGISGMLQSSSLNATSAPSPPPCGTPNDSSSSVVFISVTVAAFITIVLATGILVYVFRKLGWCIDPAAERLQNLRESARVAKPSQGLDHAIIRSFPVYTFRGDKSGIRESTTESTGLASLRRISREISRSLSTSRRISNDHVSISRCSTREENSSVKPSITISRCSTREENSSNGDDLAKESPGETGSSRGEFVVTIEGDDNFMFSLIGDSDALVANLAWACRRECAVCLGEYAAGERIKVVPACAHGFHADCIDLWLAAKTTCPICRRDLSAGEAAEAEGVTDGEVAEGTGAEGMGAAAAPAAEAAAEAAASPAAAAPAAETAVAANLVYSSSSSTASSSGSSSRESSSSSGDGE